MGNEVLETDREPINGLSTLLVDQYWVQVSIIEAMDPGRGKATPAAVDLAERLKRRKEIVAVEFGAIEIRMHDGYEWLTPLVPACVAITATGPVIVDLPKKTQRERFYQIIALELAARELRGVSLIARDPRGSAGAMRASRAADSSKEQARRLGHVDGAIAAIKGRANVSSSSSRERVAATDAHTDAADASNQPSINRLVQDLRV